MLFCHSTLSKECHQRATIKCSFDNFHFASGKLRTCNLSSQPINTVNSMISSPKNDTVEGISFQGNLKIFFLPVNIGQKFQKLKMFDASSCAIKAIFKENFKNLKVLKELTLDNNEIFSVNSNTFEDLESLETLSLREFFLKVLSQKYSMIHFKVKTKLRS